MKDVAKTKVTIRNPQLEKVLEGGKNDRDTWISIGEADGSVQHLDFLTDHEKEVFKTFSELDQFMIVQQAAIRQQFIDQSQSLNVMINPLQTTAKEMNEALYLHGKMVLRVYITNTKAAQQLSKSKLC